MMTKTKPLLAFLYFPATVNLFLMNWRSLSPSFQFSQPISTLRMKRWEILVLLIALLAWPIMIQGRGPTNGRNSKEDLKSKKDVRDDPISFVHM